MVKTLRRKFIFVTMGLMISVFGVLSIINYLYNDYWDSLSTLQMLEWLVDGELSLGFQQGDGEQGEEPNYGNAVYAVTLDSKNTILNIYSVTGKTEESIPESVIKNICDNDPEEWSWFSYIYVFRETQDGHRILFVTDSAYQSKGGIKIILQLLLILGAVLLLFAVSYFLSRFVTRPAEAALQREKQFVSDASHELKTPVGAISINAQALKGEIGDNKHLMHILSETKRMDQMIHRLLTLSYLEEGEVQLKKMRFSLSDCVEEMALTYDSVAFQKNISFVYEIEEGVFYEGNDEEIRQLTAILLDNAIKHTPRSGQLALALRLRNGRPEISVYNTGAGISQEDIPYIFDRFYSTEESRTSDAGSFGLGLAIAKSITERHGGTISVDSEFGRNACFIVKL